MNLLSQVRAVREGMVVCCWVGTTIVRFTIGEPLPLDLAQANLDWVLRLYSFSLLISLRPPGFSFRWLPRSPLPRRHLPRTDALVAVRCPHQRHRAPRRAKVARLASQAQTCCPPRLGRPDRPQVGRAPFSPCPPPPPARRPSARPSAGRRAGSRASARQWRRRGACQRRRRGPR